jgi:hypothetical protein
MKELTFQTLIPGCTIQVSCPGAELAPLSSSTRLQAAPVTPSLAHPPTNATNVPQNHNAQQQDFHQIALSDEVAISKFHREVNKDETVVVTPWDGGQRTVSFILAMSIPKSVQSFIGKVIRSTRCCQAWLSCTSFRRQGADVRCACPQLPKTPPHTGAGPIRIKERQTVTWKDEASLEIVSEPEVQVSYAKSLVTRAELAVCGNSQGVSIDVKVVVGAPMLFGPGTGHLLHKGCEASLIGSAPGSRVRSAACVRPAGGRPPPL